MMRKATSLFAFPAVCLMVLRSHRAHAMIFKVVPDASSSDDAGEVYSLLDALEMARGGDTIQLEDGTYTDQIHSTGPGEEGNPITIKGTRQTVFKATNPCIEITHSWIELEGFTVDGKTGDGEDGDSYENKCVIVDGMGESEDDALDGFVMHDMHVQNCGGECIRLKNFVVNAKITDNYINDCGVRHYVFGNALSGDDDANKNGEGIYIGTSINAWDEDFGEDRCNDNLIRGNTIQTNGNECVDVKEGSSGNMIEENQCFDQNDSESGCFSLRGDANTVRNNEASDCRGAGVRIGGGVEEDTNRMHGQMNNVYGNTFVRAVEAALTVRVMPQGKICGNSCEDCTRGIERSDDLDVGDIEDTWNARCGLATVMPTPSPTAVKTPEPIVPTPSPETETPAPVISTLSSVAETPGPTDSTPGPASDTPSPETETASPLAVTPAPTLQTPTPSGSTASPVSETPSPAEVTASPTPSGSTAPPVSETPSPADVTSSPVQGTTPSPVLETPSPVADTPSPTQRTPEPSPSGHGDDEDGNGDDDSVDDDDDSVDDDDDSVDDGDDGYMGDYADDSIVVDYDDDYMSNDEDDHMSYGFYGGDYF